MVRSIVRDTFFLSLPSEAAAKTDLPLAKDMLDTLAANAERCVGMAGNMIGVRRRVIIVHTDGGNVVMFNPVITDKAGPYEAEEGCLSLSGTRKTTRYETIGVEYRDVRWNKRRGRFSGFTAQIIQHEIDHLEGILI
jgi:peptide deformylase